jgi:hypothetical protein
LRIANPDEDHTLLTVEHELDDLQVRFQDLDQKLAELRNDSLRLEMAKSSMLRL